jgi:predicted phosphodiesterase
LRYAILADVHANLAALRTVIAALRQRSPQRWIVAGDIVGYGAYPNECVEVVADIGAICVAGNHDLIALGRLSGERISAPARVSLEWTAERLSTSSRRFLDALPTTAVVDDSVVVTHGSLADVSEYVTRPAQARAQLQHLRADHPAARVLVVGHTHRPWAWSASGGGARSTRFGRDVPEREPLLLNPGSVGQSRELVVRARGAVLDLDAGRAEFVALRYDVAGYRRVLRSVGLPPEGCHYVPPPARLVARTVRRAVAGY